jgi:ribokinase
MSRLKARIVLCQLEVPMEATESALAEARKTGAITILDPAPARTLSAAILSQVDYLTPNQTEALALLDREGESIDTLADAKNAARKLVLLGPSNVILKVGRLGCVLATPNAVQAFTGFDVQAVDTTGAGDVFNGAFATALAEGRTASDAAMIANAAAALSVTRVGAQSSIPSRSEVDLFFKLLLRAQEDRSAVQQLVPVIRENRDGAARSGLGKHVGDSFQGNLELSEDAAAPSHAVEPAERDC